MCYRPPMIVRTIPASPEHVARAREIADAAYGQREMRRAGVMGAVGAALIVASLVLAFGPWLAPAKYVIAVVAALLGCVILALGLVNLAGALVGVRLTHELKGIVAPVIDRGEVTRVDIEAARVFACEPLDEDAPAVVISDGQGRGVYLNSPLIEPFIEIDGGIGDPARAAENSHANERSATIPGTLTLILTSHDGLVLGCVCEGPRVRIDEDAGGQLPSDASETEFALPFQPAQRPQDVALLPTHATPGRWRVLLGGAANKF